MAGDASHIRAPAGPAPRPASLRVRLAELAAGAAIAVPGVAGLRTSRLGLHVTGGAGQRVDGVVVTALRNGSYEVDLHLVCELVALPALAERVRAGVLDAAAGAGLGEALGPVHVRIEAITDA